MKQELLNTILNAELLLTNFSKEEWITWAKTHEHQNVFFGIGLVTAKDISEAVPFDILGMVFLAELIRRFVAGNKVIIVVADQHAITNNLHSREKIQEMTQSTLIVLHKIIKKFDLQHFEVIQATTLNTNEQIKEIFRSLPNIPNEYLKHEVADALWLNQHHRVGIKFGWAMNKEQSVEGHDERFFDTEIKKFAPSLSFIHAKPGRTANRERPRVSPYISIVGEDRLLLTKKEEPISKITNWRQSKDNPMVKPLIRHLSQIMRLHDQLFTPLTFIPMEEKAQRIIQKIFD